jgi:hypothetical protein
MMKFDTVETARDPKEMKAMREEADRLRERLGADDFYGWFDSLETLGEHLLDQLRAVPMLLPLHIADASEDPAAFALQLVRGGSLRLVLDHRLIWVFRTDVAKRRAA